MFGGVGFMLNGNMAVGTFRNALLVRVGKERNAQALQRSGARAFEMRGRPVEGYIMIEQSDLGGDALKEWVHLAISYVRTLPPKAPKSKPNATKGRRK